MSNLWLYIIVLVSFTSVNWPNNEVAFNSDTFFHSTSKVETKEIPVMNINIYVMGREHMSEEVSLAIGENIEFINQEFNGEIQFNFDELFLDPIQGYLPDLYSYFLGQNDINIEQYLSPIEKKGGINVYIFDTYVKDDKGAALMGFTPRLKSGHESYQYNSPEFDRVFISFDGLSDKTTLVHEIGHFLGLYHPWELNDSEKKKNGLFSSAHESENHMSYHSDVHKFTSQQLELMRKHALNYRRYLLDEVKLVNIKV